MSEAHRTRMTADPRAFVDEYVAAAAAADRARYLALFDDNVVVRDEGRTHRGLTEVRRWLDHVPPVEYDVREVSGTGPSAAPSPRCRGTSPAAR
ncbi:nuclear transport factor 2 family protein [Streptomyces griseoincarnatus]